MSLQEVIVLIHR